MTRFDNTLLHDRAQAKPWVFNSLTFQQIQAKIKLGVSWFEPRKSKRRMNVELFNELEEKVKEFINHYRNLKEEHEKIKKELAEVKQIAATLENQIQNDVEKRREALGKVDDLIKLLESVPS